MALQITTQPGDPPDGTATVGYDFTVAATGGAGGLTWTANANAPVLSSYGPSAGLPSSGGGLTLDAAASDATSYVFAFVGGPTAITGLPQTVPSSSGSAVTSTIAFPANTTNSPRVYTFSVQAVGPGGATSVTQFTVTVPPTPALILSSAETASGEWWDRDAAQSTPDDAYWVYGDSNIFTKVSGAKGPTNKRNLLGSTYALNGVEAIGPVNASGGGGTPHVAPGPYPTASPGGLPASTSTVRRWPTGICYFSGQPFLTYAIVTVSGGTFTVTGWGYAYGGGHYEENNTGVNFINPRVVSGVVYGHRFGGVFDWHVYERALLSGASETQLPSTYPAMWENNGTFDGVSTYYVVGPSVAPDTGPGVWTCWQSTDFVNWTVRATGAFANKSRTFYPHWTQFGLLITWHDSVLGHTVGVLA